MVSLPGNLRSNARFIPRMKSSGMSQTDTRRFDVMFFFCAKISATNQAFMYFMFYQLSMAEDELNHIINET
jgi:hypothetical protein